MDVRIFFWEFVPVATEGELNEQQFSLIYNSKGGITYRDVLEMDMKTRAWYLERLNRQLTDENAAREAAVKNLPKPKKAKGRKR